MQYFSFVVLNIFLISINLSSSPIPPSPECHLEAKKIKDLGLQSILRNEIASMPLGEGPFQCASQKDRDSYKRHQYQIKIIKNLKVIEGYQGNATCPKTGEILKVVFDEKKLPENFTASLKHNGDECFDALYLKIL
ncbi:MAG: hypothetical protein KA116_07950 [Proteobacteria bacterium]|nr:hypothetical protein [Pseudomonadota bacterium]